MRGAAFQKICHEVAQAFLILLHVAFLNSWGHAVRIMDYNTKACVVISR